MPIAFEVNILVKLIRLYLSMAIAFSALVGALLCQHSFSKEAFAAFVGVFLLSSAASALNQYQERNLDKTMTRTRNRPLPAGSIRPRTVLYFFMGLAFAGMLVLYMGSSLPAMLLGVVNLIWYNAVYTPLKPRTAFALLIGAFNGAIPPIVGWVAAGGQITDWQILIVAEFMYLWQIPHFWLLAIRNADDYRQNQIPSFNLMVRKSLATPLLFLWILGASTVTMLFPVFRLITSPYLVGVLMLLNISVIGYFSLIVPNHLHKSASSPFRILSGFQAATLFLLCFELFL